MGSLIAVVILVVLYFIPAFVAQGKRNATAIFWLNLLAGWTVIGWVGALIWAATKDAPPVTVIQQAAPVVPVAPRPTATLATRPTMATRTATMVASPAPVPTPPTPVMAAATPVAAKPAAVNITDELERLFQLKEKGALTEEEYIVHKAKLLA